MQMKLFSSRGKATAQKKAARKPIQNKNSSATPQPRQNPTPESIGQRQAMQRQVEQMQSGQSKTEHVQVGQNQARQRQAEQRQTEQRQIVQRQVEQIQARQRQADQADVERRTRVKRKRSTKRVILTVFLLSVFSLAGFFGWYYWLTAHATFEYALQPIVILSGEDISPNAFLSSREISGNISAKFADELQILTEGRHSVPLTLSLGRRTLEATATLYVLKPIEQLFHEFAVPGAPLEAINLITNADIVTNIPFDIGFTTAPMPLEDYPVGDFALQLELNGAFFEVLLKVMDTTNPTATPIDVTTRIGEDVSPDDFVADVFDASPIASIEFVDEPDVFSVNNQVIEIKVEDDYGNSEIFSSTLIIELNQSPPVIEGTGSIISMVGNPVLYRQGVVAFDDFGRALEIHVDSHRVNQDEEGSYTVVFYAVDLTGLRTEIEETVNIVGIDPDYVNQRVDEALAGILTDGMSQLEKVKAIHTWVNRNVSYTSDRGGPETAYEGAYRALQDRRGNCFIFYSISEIMLTRAGVPNMRIERIAGTSSTHRWNLVNPDGLGWHHYDSFPTILQLGIGSAFFTNSQAESFTQQIRNRGGPREYFTFDPALYPEIVR